MTNLTVRGISRTQGDDRALSIFCDRNPTDDEMRLIHDILRDGLARGDAYRGARDDLEEWKNRALLAEKTLLRMCADHNAVNGPTHFGEPILGA